MSRKALRMQQHLYKLTAHSPDPSSWTPCSHVHSVEVCIYVF